ncbi:prealbumin-like fold domain-containing protein [Erysipelothrix sp. D19-032]
MSDFEPQFVNRDGFPYVDLQTTTFNNYRVNVIINKIDDKDRPLQGVEFTLTQDTTNTVVTTNAQGQAFINDQAPGAYVLKETKALPGYESITDSHEFIIESTHALVNRKILFSMLQIKKSLVQPYLQQVWSQVFLGLHLASSQLVASSLSLLAVVAKINKMKRPLRTCSGLFICIKKRIP